MYEEDLEIVHNILSGDKEAFNSFYEAYFPKVYNFIYMKVRDRSVTEDLTQDAFIAFVESLQNFEGRSSLLCWIFSVSKNTVYNWFRKKKKDITTLETSETSLLENFYVNTSTPLSEMEYQEYVTLCNKRFEKLSPDSKDIFLKKHFQGMSIKEICQETRKSIGAVKTDLYRTKQFLLEGNRI